MLCFVCNEPLVSGYTRELRIRRGDDVVVKDIIMHEECKAIFDFVLDICGEPFPVEMVSFPDRHNALFFQVDDNCAQYRIVDGFKYAVAPTLALCGDADIKVFWRLEAYDDLLERTRPVLASSRHLREAVDFQPRYYPLVPVSKLILPTEPLGILHVVDVSVKEFVVMIRELNFCSGQVVLSHEKTLSRVVMAFVNALYPTSAILGFVER